VRRLDQIAQRFIRGLTEVVDLAIGLTDRLTRMLANALLVLGGLAVFLILAAVALSVPVAVVYAIIKAYPGDVATKANPSWLDLVFENTYVVYSARIVLISFALVLLFGGVYIALSIAVRTYRREWLHKIGWFEASLAKGAEHDLGEIEKAYQEALDGAWATSEDLANRLEEALYTIEELRGEQPEPPPLGDAQPSPEA
jgi:hypothetical protein